VVLESAGLNATELSAYCREWISKQRQRQLILYADNGSAMRAATLQVLLEELGVLRSFSRPRGVERQNQHPAALFRTAKYRPEYPFRSFAGMDEACQWAVALVDWYVHQHRYSVIQFVV
jgi:transposase InsO family protein